MFNAKEMKRLALAAVAFVTVMTPSCAGFNEYVKSLNEGPDIIDSGYDDNYDSGYSNNYDDFYDNYNNNCHDNYSRRHHNHSDRHYSNRGCSGNNRLKVAGENRCVYPGTATMGGRPRCRS